MAYRVKATDLADGADKFLPTGETAALKVEVSGPNVLLGRLTTGAGGHEEINPAALTEETAPAAGDFLPIWTGDGLRKVDFAEFGGGGGGGDSLGTGFTSGGGTGTIPDETVANVANSFSIESNVVDASQDFKLQLGAAAFYDSASGQNAFGLQGVNATSEAFLGLTCDSDGTRQHIYFVTYSGDLSSTFLGDYDKISMIFNDNTDGAVELAVGASGVMARFSTAATQGIYYFDDYSSLISSNDRSIPDVGTVNLLKQTPVSYANGDAPNNCIFYSTTDSKLSYKDPGGTVNNLY